MRIFALIILASALVGCSALQPQSGINIVKVLPHFLDESGNHTDGPTLLHRDVYQVKLRKNPDLVHAVRYDVNWRGAGEVKVRLELRSTKVGVETMIIERVETASGRRTHWTPILIDAATYKTFGQPESWRVSLWQGKTQVGEQKSFLW
jgi:hypothetical protein